MVRSRDNVVERLLHVGHAPVRVRAWRARDGYVHIRVEPIDPCSVQHPIVPEGVPDPAEVSSAVARSRAAQPAWAMRPFRERARVLRGLASRLARDEGRVLTPERQARLEELVEAELAAATRRSAAAVRGGGAP